MGYSFSARVFFGPQHLASAAFFSRQAKVCQEKEEESELISYITSSIMLSAFSLEAMVNELVIDAVDGAKGGAAAKLTTDFLFCLKKEGINLKWGTLKKLKHVLSILELPEYIQDESPYKEIHSLFTFRNLLVHYEPTNEIIASTILSLPVTQHSLENSLLNEFPLNPKYASTSEAGNNATWHQRLLGHGAAEWAVNNACKFYEDYYKKLGLSDPFENLNLNLNTV